MSTYRSLTTIRVADRGRWAAVSALPAGNTAAMSFRHEAKAPKRAAAGPGVSLM